jgi:hypothetical protein
MAFGQKFAGGAVLLVARGQPSAAVAQTPAPAAQPVASLAATPPSGTVEYEDRTPDKGAPCTKCIQLSLAPSALALFSPGDNNLYGGLQLAGLYRVAPPDWALGAAFRGMPASGFLFNADLLAGWTPYINATIEPHVLVGPRLFVGNGQVLPGAVLSLGNHIWFGPRVGAYVDVDSCILFTKQVNPSLGASLGVALRL